MQICGVQSLGRDHGHGRVAQGGQQRADDVAAGRSLGLQHHHDLAHGPAQPGLERVAGTEGDGHVYDLVGRPLDHGLWPGHHDHLGFVRERAAQCVQDGVGAGAGAGEDDDRGGHGGRFCQPRGHRPDRAVARLALGDDVGGASRLEVVARAEVDDLPARGLDASLELVSGAVIALDARGGALVGERDDVVGY